MTYPHDHESGKIICLRVMSIASAGVQFSRQIPVFLPPTLCEDYSPRGMSQSNHPGGSHICIRCGRKSDWSS